MTTLTIPRDRLHADLLPGDAITGIDGRTLPHPLVVELPRTATSWNGPWAVRLRNRLGTETEWNLYPDSQVEDYVTVERDQQALDDLAADALTEMLDGDQGQTEGGRQEAASAPQTPEPAAPRAETPAANKTPCGHDPRYAFPLSADLMECSTCGHDWRHDGQPIPRSPWGGPESAPPRRLTRTYPAPSDHYGEPVTYSTKVRALLRRKPHFVARLRACALRPNGVWPVPAMEMYARSVGTTLGTMERNYGWAKRLDSGVWQITPSGAAVLAAWDADPKGGAR